MQYILDASIFIAAKNSYYAFDIAPGFWRAIVDLAKDGSILIPKMVKNEILNGEDELSSWLKEYSDICLDNPTPEVFVAYSGIADYVSRAYEPHHVEKFLEVADP